MKCWIVQLIYKNGQRAKDLWFKAS